MIGKAQASSFATPIPFEIIISTSYNYADMIAETDNVSNTPQTSAIIGWLDTVNVTVSSACENYSYSTILLDNTDYAPLKTAVDFKDKTTFTTNWDFENIWEMREGYLYPTLKNIVKPKN